MRQNPLPDSRRQQPCVWRVRVVVTQLAEAVDILGEICVFVGEFVQHGRVDEAPDGTQVGRLELSVQKDRRRQDENRLHLVVSRFLRQFAQAVVAVSRGGRVDAIDTTLSHAPRLTGQHGDRL